MATLDLDVKRDRLMKVVKGALLIGGLAIIAPVAWMAVQGLIALAYAGALIGGILLVWNFMPVIATWVANKRMQALIAVVEANPIETMQNLYAEKFEQLQKADEGIRDFETEIRNFHDEVEVFKGQYPEEAPTYVELEVQMRTALGNMKIEQSEARKVLAEFKARIAKAQAIFRMAMSANKMATLSQSAEARVFADIKEKVAFNSVRTSLNQTFANLNLALERRNDARAIAAPKVATSTDAPKQLAEPTPADRVVPIRSTETVRR